MLDSVVEKNRNVHGVLMQVDSYDISWKGVAGLSDPEAGLAMLPEDQFRTASSAKMMLATLMMRLVESGLVDLDAPISGYLDSDLIDGLHVVGGVDYSGSLTTRQLLQHTTGLADDWFDPRDEGRFVQMVLVEDTDRLWVPAELVAYVKENLPPLFVPGEGINYSDINYVLAGLVIESVTQTPLHDVYREWLFAPLGMDHTYMEYREPARPSVPGRTPAHVAYGDIDYTTFRSLSADWAGGGLVTTTEDMTRFLRTFVDDQVFDDASSREAMFDWKPWLGPSVEYGLGVIRMHGQTITLYGHSGVGQSFMFYWPEGDVTICGTLNQDEVMVGPILNQVAKAVIRFRSSGTP